ncbi:MAG: YfbK domain-containing protein, partial [Verrucomicrobiota bacterium]
LKYQTPPPQEAGTSDDLLTLKLRYKAPDGDTSRLIEAPLKANAPKDFDRASPDFQFAAAVAAFGMKLRGTPGSDDIAWKDIQSTAKRSLGEDPGSYRAEFLTLVEKAKRLSGNKSSGTSDREDEASPSR